MYWVIVMVKKLRIYKLFFFVDVLLLKGIFIRLVDVIVKCLNWKDILLFFGLEDSLIIVVINDDYFTVFLRILNMLEYW